MTDTGLSPADLGAIMGNNDGFGAGGSWLWFIIVILLAFGGGFGFGGNNQYATSSEVQNGFNNQNIMSRFDTISQNQTNATYENAQLINNMNTNLMQSMFNQTNAMNQGFNSVNSNINDLAHQMEQCCCNLKTQMLQDKYDTAQNQLNLAEISSANAVQTQNILGTLGKFYSNPPYPYYSGTTIS